MEHAYFDSSSHLLIGSSIILSVISCGTYILSLALVAGALGTTSQVFFQYTQFIYNKILKSDLIQKMSQKRALRR